MVLSVVEVEEVVVMTHVVDMVTELVEAFVVVHQFTMGMVPLMVCFALEQL